jgi:hypothetical protein
MMKYVIRYLAISGFGAVFLWISPAFRLTVLTGISQFEETLALYAPWSYVGSVVFLIFLLIMSFYRGAQAR